MDVTELTRGVWRAGTRLVNWYIVDGGTHGLTIVDAGLPAYRRQLGPALQELGRDHSDVRALVLTHGHIDHIGMAAAVARTGAAVYLHPADSALAANPWSNQTERPLIPYLRYPATLAFVGHCIANGALRPPTMPITNSLTDGQELEVPGRPVVTHVPGHTDGSCVLEFRDHGVAFVGDLICTASPVSGRPACPQLQTRGSNKNSRQAMDSLGRLEHLQARTLLPGHGGPWTGGVEAAVASVRRIGCR